MATAIGLNMKVTADTAGIGRGMSRVEKMLSDVDRAARSSSRSLQTLASIEIGRVGLGALTSMATTLAGIARSAVTTASQVAKTADSMGDLAARTGVSVEALQAFQFAASLSGVENLQGALQKVSVAIGKAGESGKTDAFTNLGLDFAQLRGLAPEDQFRAIASAISALPSEADRAAASVALFGKSGVELLPLFADNLSEVEERAKRLGIVLRGDQVASIQGMNDALDTVKATFNGIIGQVTANLAPAITALADDFLGFVEGFVGLDGSTGGTALADRLTLAFFDGADYVASVLDPWIDSLFQWSDSLLSGADVIGQAFAPFTLAVDLLQGAFYSARATFDFFLVGLAQYAKLFAGIFSTDAAAAIESFQAQLAQSVRDDAQAAQEAVMGRQRGAAQQGTAVLGSAAERARTAFASANTPEARAQREMDRQIQQARRANESAVADANAKERQAAEAEAKRQQQLEEDRQKKLTSLNERYAEESASIEADRLDKLKRRSNEALKVNDLRSGGIDEVIRLASGREDPAIDEARRQTAKLDDIRKEITKLGGTVDILGGA